MATEGSAADALAPEGSASPAEVAALEGASPVPGSSSCPVKPAPPRAPRDPGFYDPGHPMNKGRFWHFDDRKVLKRVRRMNDPVNVRKHLRKRKHLIQGVLLKQEMAATCHLSRVGQPKPSTERGRRASAQRMPRDSCVFKPVLWCVAIQPTHTAFMQVVDIVHKTGLSAMRKMAMINNTLTGYMESLTAIGEGHTLMAVKMENTIKAPPRRWW